MARIAKVEIERRIGLLHKEIKSRRISIDKLVKNDDIRDMARTMNIPKKAVIKSLNRLRDSLGVERPKRRIRNADPTALQKCLSDGGMVRGSKKQGPASRTIMHAAETVLPKGGCGLLIGTPGVVFASACQLNSNTFFIDEAFIAHYLEKTTDEPIKIVVGNVKSPLKAEEKVAYWKAVDMLYDGTEAYTDRVDRDSFNHYVNYYAFRHPFLKVILLTGGMWKCNIQTARKHDMDLSFADAAYFLSSKFSSLHILALCREGNSFCVRYLYRGKEVIIPPPKHAFKNFK